MPFAALWPRLPNLEASSSIQFFNLSSLSAEQLSSETLKKYSENLQKDLRVPWDSSVNSNDKKMLPLRRTAVFDEKALR